MAFRGLEGLLTRTNLLRLLLSDFGSSGNKASSNICIIVLMHIDWYTLYLLEPPKRCVLVSWYTL